MSFRLNGAALGTEDRTAPYSLTWDTATVANGVHTLAAIARDSAGNTAQSASMTVTVANPTEVEPETAPRQQYLAFGGDGDHVVIPNSGGVAGGQSITVSAWIRPAVNGVGMNIATKGRASGKQWTLNRVKSNNKVTFRVTNSSGASAVADSPANFATDNQWHHVAGVYDGTRVYLYLDGSRATSTSAPLTGSMSPAANLICIGAMGAGSRCSADDAFHGDIDDVRIYNRALNEAEIQQTLGFELSGSEAGLVGYWPFNDLQGQDVTDLSVSGLNGVLGTSVQVEAFDPSWASDDSLSPAPTAALVTRASMPILRSRRPRLRGRVGRRRRRF